MSWGLGGDELAGVRVDVVEVVVVVVVVVVGVVRRHLLDAGGDAPHRLHFRLRGCSALCPPPLAPPSPLGSRAPSLLSLGALALALALALGPLSGPVPVSRVPPLVPHTPARSLPPLSSPLRLGALPAPLTTLPVPWPLPDPLPEPRVPPLVHHAPARSLSHHPSLRPLHLGLLPALPRALPVPRPLPCPLPVTPSAAPLPLAAAPFLDHSPGVPLPLQLRQRDARRRALALRGAVVPLPSRGEGLGGVRLGGLVWVWAGLAWARYFALSLPTAAAAAAAGEASAARGGSSPACAACQGPQPLSRPPHSPSLPAAADEAPVAAVADSRTSSSVFSAAAAAACEAPTARAGSGATPLRPACSPARLRQPSATRPAPAPGLPPCRRRAGGRGGAAAWLAAVSASCASGRGGAAGLAAWAAGAAVSAGPGVPGPAAAVRPPPPPPASAPRAPRGSPPSTLGRRRGSGSGTGGGGGRPARGDPSESAITVTLVGMRGGRRALPTTSWCISAVRGQCRVVLCGGGGEGVGGRLWRQSRTAGVRGHPPALGGGAGEPRGPRVAPQLPVWGGAQGLGPPGVVERCRGQPHQMDPRNGGDLLCAQEGVYSVPRRGRREGGRGTGVAP